MRIAVNTRLLIKDRLEGIGWFTLETLKRITHNHPEHSFYFIFDRKFHDDFIFSDNIHPIVLPPQARHPLLFYLWFEYSIPYILKKINADLFFSPDGYLSLRTNIPSVNVFHDLNFEHFPDDIPFLARKHYKYYFPRYARKATRIATVSEYSKSDITKQYQIDPSKIDVVYNGGNESFMPLNKEQISETRDKYTDGRPYFIFIGALHPRKNLVNLFRAFDIFKTKTSSEACLLVVGEKMWWTPGIRESYDMMIHKQDVLFTGRLNAGELHKVLASSQALTYVSYFEGFGIPIVEAFRCEVPVITSNVTSMPEIAGDAALLTDPFKPDDIAAAMEQIEQDGEMVKILIDKGRERKEIFTWQKSADRLWQTIDNVLNKTE